MTLFYVFLGCLAIYAEISWRIDTTNILKKIALGIILIGCILEVNNIHNDFIHYAILPYVSADIWGKYHRSLELEPKHE